MSPLNLTSDTSVGPFRAETTPRGREAPAMAVLSVVRTETTAHGEMKGHSSKERTFPEVLSPECVDE